MFPKRSKPLTSNSNTEKEFVWLLHAFYRKCVVIVKLTQPKSYQIDVNIASFCCVKLCLSRTLLFEQMQITSLGKMFGMIDDDTFQAFTQKSD